jgi:hypothetical protein
MYPDSLLKLNIKPDWLLKFNIKPDWLLKFNLETEFLAVKVSFSCVSGLCAGVEFHDSFEKP